MEKQGELLAEVARLVDANILKSSANKIYKGFDVNHFERAHQEQRTGTLVSLDAFYGCADVSVTREYCFKVR